VLFVKLPNGNWLGMMRSVADGPVGVDGGWNHQPFDGEPAHCYHKSIVVTINEHDFNTKFFGKPAQTLLRQILAGEAVQKQAGSESLRIGPALVSCSITRLRSNTLFISTPSSTKKLQNIHEAFVEVRVSF
jgi:hypothetical protein